MHASRLEWKYKQYVLDGEPLRIMSGAIHYFRVVPEYWEDRLLKLKACGFNTVETYVAWNVHEPKEGAFCFEGIADLERFVRLAAAIRRRRQQIVQIVEEAGEARERHVGQQLAVPGLSCRQAAVELRRDGLEDVLDRRVEVVEDRRNAAEFEKRGGLLGPA